MEIVKIYLEQLHKNWWIKIMHMQIIRKFQKRKLYSSFEDIILDANLANKQLISKYNKKNWFFIMYYQSF